jgi:uncharacterized membrane protein YebE (DUF533 family)
MNFTDILGSVLSQGMTPSSGQRIDNSINQGGGLGDLLNSLGGSGSSAGGGLLDSLGKMAGGGSNSGGGLLDSLGKMAGAAMNSGSGGGSNPMVTGGLGALVGALLGGGKGSAKGALGGTALALLGSLAMKALQGKMGNPNSSAQLMAGLRAPENEQEAQEVQSLAELTVKAMLNAAKADQTVDKEELRRILGKASEDSLTQEEQDFISRELEKPMDTAGLIRAVPNQQVAAQIYAASLLAIEVDTDAERNYLRELASGLDLDDAVTSQLHSALGVA